MEEWGEYIANMNGEDGNATMNEVRMNGSARNQEVSDDQCVRRK